MPASRRRVKFLTVFHQDERINQLNANAGFNRTNGVIILDWQDGYATARVDLMAQHLNPAGLVHGGLYATMLDVVLAMSGCYRPPPEVLIPGLTLSLTTQFLSAMRQEDKYATATARRTGGGKSIFFAAGEVVAPDGTVVATASGAFKPGRAPSGN